MIHWLLFPFREAVPGFSVFRYITFRAAMAAATAMMLSIIFGPYVIRTLTRLKMGQHILQDSPETHQAKAGTPTMGGLLIVGAILVSTLLWCELHSGVIWVALVSLVGFCGVGAFDDTKKLLRKQNLGLRSWQKMLLLVAITLVVSWLILHFNLRGTSTSHLSVPFFKKFRPDVGVFLVPWICLVVVGTSNAVNLTDGLDGLAIGGTLIVAATFAILAYVAGNAKMAQYLFVPFVPGGGELAVFLGAMCGASLGFLWFNAHPAEVFMGDTGSLALGGALGTVAIMIKQELLLVIAGGLFVLEAMSVILQVGSFKLRGGKRIFRMAPLHHHFELKGVPESKIIIRFWILSILMALMALSTLKLR